MKILTSLIVGGALTLGSAMAQDAPKPAAPAASSTQKKAKVKRHRLHKKAAKANQTPAPADTATKK